MPELNLLSVALLNGVNIKALELHDGFDVHFERVQLPEPGHLGMCLRPARRVLTTRGDPGCHRMTR